MDRRDEPYWGSIGIHAHREVDAWFHRMHPQFSHWEEIRKKDIRIHWEPEELFLPKNKWRIKKRAFKVHRSQQYTGWGSNYSTGDPSDWQRGGGWWISGGFLGFDRVTQARQRGRTCRLDMPIMSSFCWGFPLMWPRHAFVNPFSYLPHRCFLRFNSCSCPHLLSNSLLDTLENLFQNITLHTAGTSPVKL